MLTTVSAKPIAVWAVSAVPTKRWSAASLSAVENTGESATTAAAQMTQKTTSTGGGAAKANGDSTQHVPLMTRATTAAGERPKRSAPQPPSRQPAAPARPIATKTTMPVVAG